MGNTMERSAPPANALFWAKRSFGYGIGVGRQLDRGQVFKLEQLPNDRLLVDLGYCGLLEKGTTTYACRGCGAEFVDQRMRDSHGDLRHSDAPKFQPPPPPERESGESKESYQNRLDDWSAAAGRMADSNEERRQNLEEQLAPLDLTKTAASRE